ncbi:MAG: hypothetical protein C0424_11975 [Sphingobacteriaceae bacterium]|nr:hypothetical protein [Sphingobacteriaceae bacterium]
MKRAAVLLLSVLWSGVLCAQSPSLGMPFFDEALRRAQLLGQIDSNISFTIRPVDAERAAKVHQPFGADSLIFGHDERNYWRYGRLIDSADRYRLVLLPVVTKHQFNQHHPYGWSNGPMIPNKGWQHYLSAGLYLKLRFLELQFRPETIIAENRDFLNPPVRNIRIDFPDRFGTEPYQETFLGQSFIKAHIGPIAFGAGTNNVWVGPGTKNAIILGNNAPGFRHFIIHSNRPIKTRLGSFEFQILGGPLQYSGFYGYGRNVVPGVFPMTAADIERDTLRGTRTHSWASVGTVVYQPKWVSGLFLGANRVVQDSDEPKNGLYFLRAFGGTGAVAEDLQNRGPQRNQIISIFGRYLIPSVQAEFYFDIGREDYWRDLEDLLTNPTHSVVWQWGFRKMKPLAGKNHWLEFSTEVTKIEMPASQMSRASGYSFYTHNNQVGWTHRGQVLGAGIGPGSNMYTLGILWNKGYHQLGLSFERVAYHEDMFHTRMPFLRLGNGANPFQSDFTKHFVDIGGMLEGQTTVGRLMLGARWHLLRTYNFQWIYTPFGGDPDGFRFPGIHVWSHNLQLFTLYRF